MLFAGGVLSWCPYPPCACQGYNGLQADVQPIHYKLFPWVGRNQSSILPGGIGVPGSGVPLGIMEHEGSPKPTS